MLKDNLHSSKLTSLLIFFIAPLLCFLIWSMPNEIIHLQSEAQISLGIMIWVAGWWISHLIPLHISGIIGLLLAHFQGLSSWKELIAPFSHPIIFLFMGGFFMAKAIEYHKIDKWLVHKTINLSFIRGNSQRLYISLVFLTAFLSAILSNTATTALILPLALELLQGDESPKNDESPYHLLLLIAGAASIGGMMTPVGSPPNIIALGLLEKITGSRPDFVEWVMKMLPLSMLILLGLLYLYRKDLNQLKTMHLRSTQKMSSLSSSQKIVLVILFLTASLWALPSVTSLFSHELSQYLKLKIPESVVALFSGVLLISLPTKKGPLLPWNKAQEIDWGTLMLFGSGMSLGLLIFKSGLAQVLAKQIEAYSYLPPFSIIVLSFIGVIFFTELASNTATANLILPVLFASTFFSAHTHQILYGTVAAANLAFMLPVGTPPNAIIFSTGKIKLSTMIQKGILVNLLSLFILIIYAAFIF